MQLLTARLSSNPREVNTKHGARMVADAETVDGETLTVWRPANDATLSALSAGSLVTLALDSKGKVSLVDNPEPEGLTKTVTPQPTAPKPQGKPVTLDNDTKREIAAYITQQKDLLSYCMQQAATIPGVESEDVLQKMAVTLYLSAQRRFNLD